MKIKTMIRLVSGMAYYVLRAGLANRASRRTADQARQFKHVTTALRMVERLRLLYIDCGLEPSKLGELDKVISELKTRLSGIGLMATMLGIRL